MIDRLSIFCVALLLISFSARAGDSPALIEAGLRETSRLRVRYAEWREEAPRKIAIMEVPLAALSQEARTVGFLSGVVDSEVVILRTYEAKDGTAGFLFGTPSRREVAGLQSLGYVFQPTITRGILRFSCPTKK